MTISITFTKGSNITLDIFKITFYDKYIKFHNASGFSLTKLHELKTQHAHDMIEIDESLIYIKSSVIDYIKLI